MRRVMQGMVLAGVLAVAAPQPGAAQGVDAGWWEWAAPAIAGGQEVPTRRGGVVIPQPRTERRSDRDARGSGKGQGNGPAFCRSGEGHPKHGRRWCLDKGWGLGDRRMDGRWERRRWEDVVLGEPRGRRAATLDEGTLIDVLGDVVFRRVANHRRQVGAAEPLVGRWSEAGTPGGRVLQVRSGSIPLAELSDLDGDGRVDLVLVYRGS